jgi:hypothetical protein
VKNNVDKFVVIHKGGLIHKDIHTLRTDLSTGPENTPGAQAVRPPRRQSGRRKAFPHSKQKDADGGRNEEPRRKRRDTRDSAATSAAAQQGRASGARQERAPNKRGKRGNAATE